MSQWNLCSAKDILKPRPNSSVERNPRYGSSGKYSSNLLNKSEGSVGCLHTQPFHLVWLDWMEPSGKLVFNSVNFSFQYDQFLNQSNNHFSQTTCVCGRIQIKVYIFSIKALPWVGMLAIPLVCCVFSSHFNIWGPTVFNSQLNITIPVA